jgi:uncharacterized protein (AIM24 family)
MTIHGNLFQAFAETQGNDQFTKQGSRMLKVQMGYGPVVCKEGAMVAYQGQIGFQKKSQGVGRVLKGALTGEGVALMEASGQGELFLAHEAAEVQVLYLENDMISVNGPSILAFSSSIQWDIHRVQAKGAMLTGGLFNVSLRGTGYVALITHGQPVALNVTEAPTFGDPQAVVMWTGGVSMDVRVDTGGLGTLLRGGSGETFQMAFSGQGHVLIQPWEPPPAPSTSKKGGGGVVGGVLDVLGG